MPTSSKDGDGGKGKQQNNQKEKKKNKVKAEVAKNLKNGTSVDAQSTSSAASSRTVHSVPPSRKLSASDAVGSVVPKVKLPKRTPTPPNFPLIPSVIPLMNVHLEATTTKSKNQVKALKKTEDKTANAGTAVSADTFQEAFQYPINSFPLERNVNILVDKKFTLLITPTTSRCNGLYIKVKSQNSDEQLCTGALLRLDSDDKSIRAACQETIENFAKVSGKGAFDRFPFSTRSEDYLNTCHIRRLDERQDAFPEAIYYCEKCDYHINTISHAKAHLESSTHFDDIRRQEQRERLLEKIPEPTSIHLKAINKVLGAALEDYQQFVQTRQNSVKFSDRILLYLNNTIFPTINARNFVLRPFGSATYDVVLPDSDYNIAYTMDLPEGTPIFALLEQIRKKIADDGYPADHSMEMGTPSTILFHFENVRVRLCWMSSFKFRSQLYLSELMKKYVDLREEVVEFLQLIRLWACRSEVDSKNKPRIGLPRYGFDLMAIHFLQQQKYLPVLHELFEEEEEVEEDLNCSRDDVESELSKVPEEAGQRRIRLMSRYEKDTKKIGKKFDLKKLWDPAELFIKFFRYYVQNHRDVVIQITQSTPMSRDANRWNKKILHVVDPFRGDNVLSIPKVSTWQPFYFNCLLTTYLSFAIPRTKNGPIVEVGLIHTKSNNPKKKLKEAAKRHVDTPPSTTSSTVIHKANTPITEEEYQHAADELAEESEHLKYMEKLLNDLTIDGIRYQNRKPDNCHIDDHRESIYSNRTLLRFRRVLDTSMTDELAVALDDHDLLTKKGKGWIKRWKKRTGYGSQPVDTEKDPTVAEITEKLEQQIVISDDRGDGSSEKGEWKIDVVSTDINLSEQAATPSDAETGKKSDASKSMQLAAPKTVDETKLSPHTLSPPLASSTPVPPFPPHKPSSTFHKTTPSIPEKQICTEEFFIRENLAANEIAQKSKKLREADYLFEFTSESFCGFYEMEMRCTHCDGSHCVEKCPMMEIPPIKKFQARTKEDLKDIDAIIDKYYKENIMDAERMQMMEEKIKDLQSFMRKEWSRDISLTVFGSVMTGLSVNCSDIDICLRFGTGDIPPKNQTPKDVIIKAENILNKCSFVKRVQAIVSAKVPIVKFQLKLSNGVVIDADISYYNILAIYNTALLREYTLWTPDHRFAKLALFIKKWAKSCDIGDASRGSLSSYAHVILLISYLQNCDPPVLPRLQEDFRDDSVIEKRLVDNWDTCYAQVEQQTIQKWPKNKETCAQLLIGYFDYYSRYDFRNFVVQCRRPMILSKMEKDWPRPLCVEDPFDLNHNLSSGVTKKMFVFIMKVFINSRAVFMSETPINIDRNEHFVNNYQTQLLKKCHQGSAPTDRQCHMCHKIGHFVESCPQRIQKDARRRYGSNSTNSSYRSINDHTTKRSEDGGTGGGYGADRLTSHKRAYYLRNRK
uniref:RNA uridylyltransferase n=1 Tax=Caenorhabditis tropicalis TaxID=1561998 RepID=A0A1I7TWM1_9PELO